MVDPKEEIQLKQIEELIAGIKEQNKTYLLKSLYEIRENYIKLPSEQKDALDKEEFIPKLVKAVQGDNLEQITHLWRMVLEKTFEAGRDLESKLSERGKNFKDLEDLLRTYGQVEKFSTEIAGLRDLLRSKEIERFDQYYKEVAAKVLGLVWEDLKNKVSPELLELMRVSEKKDIKSITLLYNFVMAREALAREAISLDEAHRRLREAIKRALNQKDK